MPRPRSASAAPSSGWAATASRRLASSGDADPLQAIADALRFFPADAIVVATHPPGRSNWLARDLVARARRRFDLPIVHIVVEPAHRREYVLEAA